MDERKNIKVIDEHGIDRAASIMCGIDVDGTDYVIYSIKRDEENDNLFASKLIKNNDGTSNMVNIEDSMEKSKLADIVKKLITYSINNDADKTTGVVTLADGKEIKISGVLFNKEQNINVGKTYITTVKRAVTKVGANFYSVEASKAEPVVESVFDTPAVSDNIFPEAPSNSVEAPIIETPVQSAPVVEPILPEMPANNVEVEPILPETPSVSEPVLSQPVEVATNSVVTPALEPILPETPVINNSVINEPLTPSQDLQAKTTIVGGDVASVEVPKQEEFLTPPVSVVEPKPTPVVATEPSVTQSVLPENQLVFDGSKETNLNVALGEVSKDNILPVSDVAPIREFGQDEPVIQTSNSSVDASALEKTSGPVLTRKAGFANNKFFMVVAIAFFLAACVFLGYEVFRYFKIVG